MQTAKLTIFVIVIGVTILGFYLFIMLTLPLSVFWWPSEKQIVRSYYDNLIQEKYQDNYKILYLFKENYDDTWVHSDSRSKQLYQKEIEHIKKEKYRVLRYHNLKFLKEDFVKYAQITLTVEVKGYKKSFNESIQITNEDKIWVDYSEDPMAVFRDGQLKPGV